jgi:hypothetical protein
MFEKLKGRGPAVGETRRAEKKALKTSTTSEELLYDVAPNGLKQQQQQQLRVIASN